MAANGKSYAKPNANRCGVMRLIQAKISTPIHGRNRMYGSEPNTTRLIARSLIGARRSASPAQSFDRRRQGLTLRHVHQIEDDLAVSHVALQGLEYATLVQPHDENIRLPDDRLDVAAQERTDVWQVLLDEPPVRPEELGQVDLGVVDQKAEPLADELLGHEHQRALAQVIGPGLEGQSDHADPPLAARQNLGDGMVYVDAVRREHATVHRQLDVVPLGEIQGGAQVLRQA